MGWLPAFTKQSMRKIPAAIYRKLQTKLRELRSSAAISEELALWDLRLSPEKIEDIVKQVRPSCSMCSAFSQHGMWLPSMSDSQARG